jgi:hypothetical protein
MKMNVNQKTQIKGITKMAKVIFSVALDPDKDVAKVPAGAKALGIVAAGENLKAIFEADETAPLVAVEFKYPMAGDVADLEGFTYVGLAGFNDGEAVALVYARQM